MGLAARLLRGKCVSLACSCLPLSHDEVKTSLIPTALLGAKHAGMPARLALSHSLFVLMPLEGASNLHLFIGCPFHDACILAFREDGTLCPQKPFTHAWVQSGRTESTSWHNSAWDILRGRGAPCATLMSRETLTTSLPNPISCPPPRRRRAGSPRLRSRPRCVMFSNHLSDSLST